MTTPLRPNQVALLANLIVQAVTKFPIKPFNWQDAVKSIDEEITMDPWEAHLKEEVNKRSTELPDYDTLQRDHMDILEFLVNYYTETPELADNLGEVVAASHQ